MAASSNKRTHNPEQAARKALLTHMEFLSENFWCAGWSDGLEFTLWGAVECWRNDCESDHPYLFDHAEVLSWLAEQADGWWIWDNSDTKQDGRRFVSAQDWEIAWQNEKTQR